MSIGEDGDLEDVSDSIEDGDYEEQWMVNEKTDVDEASSVSVEEQNNLPSEADSDSLLSDRTSFLSEIDGSDTDPFSGETENPNNYTELKLEDILSICLSFNTPYDSLLLLQNQSMNMTLHSDGDLEDVSDSIEDGDCEEQWMVNEKTDVDEASSVSVEEQNNLPSFW
nr:hypothetical protein [Tanacetum cinerariifolium]